MALGCVHNSVMTDTSDLLKHTPLGNQTTYEDSYNPELLCAVRREDKRRNLHVRELALEPTPFRGEDRWTAYEVSWLTRSGKPAVALAELIFPCDTDHIIESKSLKLYLNSLNQTAFESPQQLQMLVEQDLSERAGGQVKVTLLPISTGQRFAEPITGTINGICLDNLDIYTNDYQPNPNLLAYHPNASITTEIVYSHLLKTNCPVTGQPDWATLLIEYHGKPLVHTQLLKYIISFRQHQGFHEHCVEQIFCDILHHVYPDNLTVYARYTRRGGLDINPLRTNFDPGESQLEHINLRISRQ